MKTLAEELREEIERARVEARDHKARLAAEQRRAEDAERQAAALHTLVEEVRGQRDRYRAEADAARAELERAWKAFPSAGAVRGLGVEIAEVVADLVEKRDEARAIIEGRITPPTDAEIERHWRTGGVWLFQGVLVLRGVEETKLLRDQHAKTAVRWLPIGSDRHPCAWPVAGGGA